MSLSFSVACEIWCLSALTSTVDAGVLFSSVFFTADPVVGELDDLVVNLDSPEGAPPTIFGLPLEPQGLGPLDGG